MNLMWKQSQNKENVHVNFIVGTFNYLSHY